MMTGICYKFFNIQRYGWAYTDEPIFPIFPYRCSMIWISGIKSERIIDYWHSLIPIISSESITIEQLLKQGDIMTKQDIRDKIIWEILDDKVL